MIELYSWPTPNGRKVHIALEEFGLPYRAHGIDIGKGDQFTPDFLKISPNNKIPALLDPQGPDGKPISIFESGAILIYLAEKTGRFMPSSGAGRYSVLQWLMFQMGGVGPMFGQANHFRTFAPEKIPYAIDRYTNEVLRLSGVMDKRLAETRFLAGDDYSIADIATWPWISYAVRQGIDVASFQHLMRWNEEIASRPAVQRGLAVLSQPESAKPMSAEERNILFGNTQYQQR
ncbi:glutathione S-transferase N-terminal domain-containing protein [Dongia soli]|uniref:Glutathione S-transferase N-terminal domain-containing protein n=1 Tax=Dongia soli TaxID=600628 RepID=A0ABU5EAV7_9PROT|nr:glutathione S-transferase N-terminal domain-containing protein [Dongia soli]MDY0882996.1 glutathione S-transferase N-terminal domain-containing protein [Dongia soli]